MNDKDKLLGDILLENTRECLWCGQYFTPEDGEIPQLYCDNVCADMRGHFGD